MSRLANRPTDDAGDSLDGVSRPLSHSIINERSKLSIGRALDAASKIFPVIFAVNLSGTSIGAGFRPVRPKLTFRDLSTSIDFHDDCGKHRRHNRRASASVGATPKKGWHQTHKAIVPTHFSSCFSTVRDINQGRFG
jgi:hypothetical protein